MPIKKTRRSRRRKGVLSKIYRPVSQVIGAANDITNTTTKSVNKIVHAGLNGMDKIGKNITGRADKMINDIMPRGKRRQTRRK